MKKDIINIAHSLGCKIRYSGAEKRFFVTGIRANEVYFEVLDKIGYVDYNIEIQQENSIS